MVREVQKCWRMGCAKKGEVRDEWEGQGQVKSALTFILKRLDFQLQDMGSY